MSSTILLIRHAEKPNATAGAVAPDGSSDPESLIVPGWQRAGALAVFFGAKGGAMTPQRIYASSSGKKKLGHKEKIGSDSERPMLTVSSLAAKLEKTPIDKFTKGQEAALAEELVSLDGTTLVCWQHEAIPAIATAILGSGDGVPDPWPSDRFDAVWRFVRAAPGGSWTFDQLCPQLLAGDKPDPIQPA